MLNPHSFPSSWRQRFALLAVIGLAVLLRLWQLGNQGLWLDEAWSWAMAALPPLQILQATSIDLHPPLYYLLLSASMVILPPTEAGLRVLSTLSSLAAVALVIHFAARQWGGRSAAYAGLFIAVSSFDLYYAQETRMYTLLAVLWLASYVLLVAGLQGREAALVFWGIVNAAMVWTHYYGLVVAAVHVALGIAACLVGWHRGRTTPLPRLGVGIAITFASAIPSGILAVRFAPAGGVGSWLPTPEDRPALFGLITAGLTAARGHFLNAARLSLPALREIPAWAWLGAGLLVCGVPACVALWGDVGRGGSARLVALLAVGSVLGTIAAVYVCGSWLGMRVWAPKPFLGSAYLIYVWAGRGLAIIPRSVPRMLAACMVVAVSLASIVPYFSGWSKTEAAVAFRSLPAEAANGPVLLDRIYTAPVAFYYLGPDSQVWGLQAGASGGRVLARKAPNGILRDSTVPMTCEDIAAADAGVIAVYGMTRQRLVDEIGAWPACLVERKILLFEGMQWVRLER